MEFWDVFFYFYIFIMFWKNRLVFNNCYTPLSSHSRLFPLFFFKVTMFLVKLLIGKHRMKATLRRQFYFPAGWKESSLQESCACVHSGFLGGREWASRADVHPHPGRPDGGMPFCKNDDKKDGFQRGKPTGSQVKPKQGSDGERGEKMALGLFSVTILICLSV